MRRSRRLRTWRECWTWRRLPSPHLYFSQLEDKNKIRNVKNNTHLSHCSTIYEVTEGKKWIKNMRHLYQKSFTTSSLPLCPYDGVDVYIFDCWYFILYNIGSSGKFPLPLYCALPIATLELIYCIYILFDTLFDSNINAKHLIQCSIITTTCCSNIFARIFELLVK